MTDCQFCDSKLVTDGLFPGQQIRCANCHSLSRFGKVEKVATHRLAWRSFWLGISSILLLTITGIPALYYGVRSLLRMRFVKPERRDQVAAIIGTSLGGCFGIFVGFIAVCGLIMAFINYLTFAETTDSTEVAQRCSQIFEFSSPHVVPTRARSVMNSQYLFDFADKPELENRKLGIRLVFIRAGLQPNGAVMTQQLRNKRVGKTSFGTNHEAEFLDWQFSGHPINVKKSVYSRTINPDSEAETAEETHRHYWGYIRNNRGFYGMSVVFEPDMHDLSDSDVKEIFASTQLKID
jgi:hypothetical protein